jgi:hypothetical protein
MITNLGQRVALENQKKSPAIKKIKDSLFGSKHHKKPRHNEKSDESDDEDDDNESEV